MTECRSLKGLVLLVPVILVCLFLPLFPLSSGEAARGEGAAVFDWAIPKLIKKYNIPGATMSIMKDGRLVIARGYGITDREHEVHTRPDTLFRVASVSKTITAVGIMKLVQEGKLNLDRGAFSVLNDLAPFPGHAPDPRFAQVTVRDLLRHSGGWDSEKSGDPQFMNLDIACETGLQPPVDARVLIRYWMGKPLDHDPGKKYVYSNFGYNILGRIIEKVTGQTYEDYINSAILIPLGIRRMQIGKTLRQQRAKGEGTYYFQPGAELVDSVFPALGKVPEAYGGWSHPSLDAHGGWIASSVDLLRFIRGIEGSGGRAPILPAETIREMTAFQGLENQSPEKYYALGWNISNPGTPSEQWSHAGALTGSNAAWLVRRADGVSYALTFNSLPDDYIGFFGDLEQLMRQEIAKFKSWPNKDLFPKYL